MASVKWSDSLIVADTREQDNLFPDSKLVTLRTGDYSLEGYETICAIERKSGPDLIGSCGGRGGVRRLRLLRAFRRLGQLRYRAVVIESTQVGLYRLPRFGRVTPGMAIATALHWSFIYSVPVLFCEGQTEARNNVRAMLKAAWERETGVGRTHHDLPACVCGGGLTIPHRAGCKVAYANARIAEIKNCTCGGGFGIPHRTGCPA